jgi:anaerobic selenocysteine-containing dehydrogenase
MPTVSTTCPMDCPDTCALEVRVEDGVVRAIGGAADHPTTRGFLCSKVAKFHRRLDHPDRLLHPMRRAGAKGEGRFERISWDEAIAEVAARFREVAERWGGEAILPYHYGGSNGLLSEDFVDDLLFARLGASRLDKTICAAPSSAVARDMYGKMPGVAHEDYPRARCIVVWGANPKASQIHLVPFLKQARAAGTFVAVVDPQRHFSAREVDLHLPVRPGTDLPVALALIHRWREEGRLDAEILDRRATGLEPLLAAAADWTLEAAAEEAGIEAADLARLADAYAGASPALIRTGWGLERNSNGGRAMAAILAMPALLGKFGLRGGGYTMSNSGAASLDRRALLGELDWHTRVVNMTELGRWLAPGAAEPPVRALFVYNANPAVTVPDQNAILAGLARTDLYTVVFEQVMTDTARWADLLLPAATFLEQWELKVSYGSYGIGGIRPAVARCGEARPNVEVFAALGRALGFPDEPFGWDEETAFHRAAEHLTFAGRPVDVGPLAEGRWVRPRFSDEAGGAGETPVQLASVQPRTPDGRIHLTPACLGAEPFRYRPVGDRRWPLALVSPGSHRMITSTMGEYNFDRLTVTLSPADAAARGVASGDAVRVWNGQGVVECDAMVSGGVRPGVAVMPKGAWRRHSANGATSTALTPAHVNDVAGGACFNDARVDVARLD